MSSGLDRFSNGMALQLAARRAALAAGSPRLGWKVGFNVPEVQKKLGLPHSAIGWIDGRRSVPSGSVVEVAAGTNLHVEAEIALRIGTTVPVPVTAERARGCIAALHPALELVDYALPAPDFDAILGHSMFHAASVIGDACDPASATALGRQWPRFTVGGRDAGPVRDDLVPDDLGALVAFVAGYLAAFGHALEAGDVLLSGSFTARAVRAEPGDEAVADFGPLGGVSVRLRMPARTDRTTDGIGRSAAGGTVPEEDA